MSRSKTKIIVCCHKHDRWISNDVYLPVQGGKSISEIDLNIQGDDTGDNISHKNKSYCELTSIYWAWKNLKNIDYIGLCHYRRYFSFKRKGNAFFDLISVNPNDIDRIDVSVPDLDKLFRKYDIVLVKPRVYPVSIFIDYSIMHYSDDVREIERIIIEKYPDYKQSVRRLFYNSNKISHYNMFVMTWANFNRYCEWLFNVLEEAEKRVNIENYSNEQKRIWGFMGERLLLPLYVSHNSFKVKYYPVYFLNDYINLKSAFHRFHRFLRKTITFHLGKSLYHN